jgi:hypothetical protein
MLPLSALIPTSHIYDDRDVEFRVPSAQVIEQSVVFVGARCKHVRIREQYRSTWFGAWGLIESEAPCPFFHRIVVIGQKGPANF